MQLEKRHLWNFCLLYQNIFHPLTHIYRISSYHPLTFPLTYWVDFSPSSGSCCHRNVMKWKFLFISLTRRNSMQWLLSSLPISTQMMKRKAINLKICLPLTRNFNYFYFYSFPLSNTHTHIHICGDVDLSISHCELCAMILHSNYGEDLFWNFYHRNSSHLINFECFLSSQNSP